MGVFERTCELRLVLNTLLRLVSGIYFVLTSIYCLLAFLPYTFFFLIKAPPYSWMPWFVRHQATLYPVAATAAVAANWPLRKAWAKREHRFLIGAGRLLAAGVYLSLHPFLRGLEDNRTAHSWSPASLLPLIAFTLWRQVGDRPVEQNDPENGQLGHCEGLLIAAAVSVIYTAGSRMGLYSETRTMAFHWSDAEFTLWSFISHLMLAIVVVSGINLVFMLAAKTPKPRSFRRAGVCVLVLSSLWFALSRFLEDVSFAGWGQCLRRYACGGAYAVWILDCPPVSRRRAQAAIDPEFRQAIARCDRRVDHAGSVSRASREWGVAARLIGTLGLGDADFRIISQ